ncbi:STAG-domain-containing protein [Sporormia fimetaria CBS 119925]|uniref:STAG-domain-containing protein n=1 Tax=Sporormia fimetaria CBS 119925 TaxID=1340428 RepID=A0A6A6UV67_9PLEO|nr:STAG-domain-containing protein [Sporormia fimetaria CBS 119925]
MNKRKRTVSLAIRPATKKARVRKSAVGDTSGGLYAQVFGGDSNVDDIAAEWLTGFNEHEAKAVAQLVNFVFRCSGCSIEIDEDDVGDPDNCPNRLAEVQDEYQAQDITDYPLIAKTKGAAAFKITLQAFFTSLIETLAQANTLYENPELLENIQVWVSSMTSSSNRPFRHTSTVVCLSIISGLCRVGRQLVENAAKKNRQRETESKKARVNKARLATLKQEIDEINERLQLVNHTLTDWFDTVYVHRYRDVDPKIRVECVDALADWVFTYPDKYFDGTHLRYMGWVLSDPHAPTRAEVLKHMQKLFRDKDKISGLKTFSERFRPRLVEMATHDAETSVRAASIQLLDTFGGAGLLEPDDVDSICRLIFDAEPKVRKAVVGFFAETINSAYEQQIEDMGGQEAVDEALGEEGEEDLQTPRLEWLKLKCLVEQLVTYDSEDSESAPQIDGLPPSTVALGLVAVGLESRFYLAAQALYDNISELRSWEVLAGYLLHDHSEVPAQNGGSEDVRTTLHQTCKLSDREEVVLLDVLTASVKLDLQRLAESQKEKKKTKAEKQALKEEEAEAVKKLSGIIPKLLKKFGASPEAAALCLRLERQLNLDIFQELRQDAALAALLDDVSRQFLTHHHERVLDEAIESILHALTHEDSRDATEPIVRRLWDDIIDTFIQLRKDQDLTTRGSLDDETLTGITNTVLKIAKLGRISEPSVLDRKPVSRGKPQKFAADAEPPISSLLEMLGRGIPSDDVDAETDIAEDALTRHTMSTMLLYFVWKARHCADAMAAGTPVADNILEAIATRRDACITALVEILRSRKGADEIRLDATNLLLDISNLLYALPNAKARANNGSPQNADDEAEDEDWRALCQKIDKPTTKLLLNILSAAEMSVAKLTGKKLEDVDVDAEPLDVDGAPEDSDDEEETEGEERKMRALLAEGRLCFLGSRLVHGVQVGTLGDDVRKRLERNKMRLGHDWKEIVGHLAPPKAPRAQRSRGGGKKKKSEEVVVEVEDDEIEDSAEE